MKPGGWGGREATRLTELTLATYGNVCHLCGLPGATTADHVLPRSRGGDNSIDNLRPAHKSCNFSRGNMSIEEWKRKHPRRNARAEPSRRW